MDGQDEDSKQEEQHAGLESWAFPIYDELSYTQFLVRCITLPNLVYGHEPEAESIGKAHDP